MSKQFVPLSAWLLRPFLNLDPIMGGSILTEGVISAYDQVIHPEYQSIPLQTNPVTNIRNLISVNCGLPRFICNHPKQLPVDLQTPQWRNLVNWLEKWSSLDNETKHRVVTLLNRMGLYQTTVQLIEPITKEEIATDLSKAELAARLDLAKNKLVSPKDRCLETLKLLALSAPAVHLRVRAAGSLIVHYSKTAKNFAEIQYWADIATEQFKLLPIDNDPIALIQASMYFRAIAFIPYLQKNHVLLNDYMNKAEEYAKAFPKDDSYISFVSRENWHPLLETGIKCAFWTGDVDKAIEKAKLLVAHDPMDPKVHMHLGDSYRQIGLIDKAMEAYMEAARIGFPYKSYALFMVGVCYEQLEDMEEACNWYLQSSITDPSNFTAIEHLHKAATSIGKQYAELTTPYIKNTQSIANK
ncbi:tetratricopeptide repeat protein [Paenibacillus enshidis]|uniref:Tetratricopeptide repeat protein n=1 Tax=Paenibacillus enshidis TaxID=1458439 RepID=A0ABV5AZ73_9BACL